MSDEKVTIDPRRGEAPLAQFFQRRQPWVARGACHDLGKEALFFPDYDKPGPVPPGIYDAARALCELCPVRQSCGEDALEEEAGYRQDHRHGLRAYMTPAQRHAIERLGGLNGRDPMKVVLGTKGRKPVPGLSDEGDNWSRHHTTLARKALKWIEANVAVGETLPTQTKLCAALECNTSPLRRVMEALVQDGTLDQVGSNHTARGANGATVKYVRRRTVRRIASWTPQHIPAQIDQGVPSD